MARRYETITELYRKTVAGLAAPQAWQSFLTTACHNFRLPFDEQVLLYAQRPDATAVLPIEGKNGWNQRFGRWVNRGATGIAVFDGDAVGRSRLKYYFDISDTHESRFARPVPIWTMRPEYEPAVIEALENSFGDLEDKTDLAAALLSAAKNAAQDNMPDYLTELKYYKENSFLEELDDLNIEVEYRRALENSIGYMLLARCGIDPAAYFTDDDFRDVVDFSTPETLNALGTATGDIGQMCLSAVSRTALMLQRQAERETRTFAEKPTIRYPDAEKKTTTPERSEPYERTDIHDAGRLPAAESASAPGAGNAPWEIRIAAEDIPETAPQSDLHEPADIGQAEPAPDGDRAGSSLPDGTADQPDGESRGSDGGTESQRPDEVDGADEQHQALGGGDSPERTDLQLTEQELEADSAELPAFLDDNLIMAIIANKDDDLKYKKQQIELYFSIHPEEDDRAEYLKSAYQGRYTEILVDGVRVGYKPQEDGLLMWEGAYLSRTSESVFSWGVVAGWTAQLIDKKEYFINTKITPPKNYDSQQLSLFDFADFNAPAQEESGQFSFMPRPQLPQQVIDEALCIGANDKNSRLIICAYFMKDHASEENATFLAKHYGTNGAGFYINERKYSIWYGDEGIRISDGESAQRRYATLLTWEQAARRIRELLDLGRYMPQNELDRVVEYERKTLAESLALTARDFSEEARDVGYAPTLRLALSAKGGFPEIEQQISELLKDPDMLQKITEEWGEFVEAHEQNRNLMRFGYNRPKELLQKLTDLQREPVTFTAAEDYNPQRRFFISMEEIDKVLRGGGEDYRLAVYSFFVNHPDQKDREKYLKNYHGEYSGYHGGNDNRTYTSKGLSFSHGDLTQPYAKVELKWSVIVKSIDVLMSQDRFLSDQDREAMAGYEIRQLARSIHSFFIDAPELYPRPYQANPIGDYWEGVQEVVEQLTNPNRVEEIYQMMLPLWEGTLQDDRHYQRRKTGLENMQAYRAGTYSVFNRAQTLRPLSSGADTPAAEPETPKPELPVTPAEEEQNHVSQNEELEEAKQLINEYCLEVFDQEADFSDLSHVDLAFSSTSDSENTVEIFADLAAFRLVYQVDSETVHEIACKNLSELNGYLANLDFDEMVAHADERYQQEHADRGELAEHEPEPKEPAEKEQSTILAPPKPKRERVVFTTLHPEIPADQRRNFRITDSELGYGTRSEKYAANVAAIRCLKEIEAEERLATPEEQEILSRYVGWGGLADCFDERHGKYLELKSLLDEDEYAAARASSLTAFYTSPVIIGAMYQALSQMGFRHGNILEPSCGVGNFIGMLPDSMADSKAYGVEIDSISGRIAQQLYQNSSIAVNGFEKVQMPDSFFDVAIGNVPFGDFKVRDKKYDKNHWLIHDYFFGKTLDKVRPGGVIAFITSKGTMDKENSAVRKYLAQRADLIGAIRLPNNAFKANAGTEVTSDIIFLQKRDRMTDIEPDWVHLDTDENGIRMNRYFVQHPEMVLGDMVMESTRFGMDSTCRAYEDADLSELLSEAVQNLHAQITDYEVEELDEEEDRSIPADPAVRNFSFCLVDGKVHYRENSRMQPIEVSITAENRIRGMIAIRECVRRLLEYQTEGYPDEDIQKEQAELNRLYDDYTKKYGLLSSRGNSLAFGEDASYCLLCSLEVLDEEGNLKRKADMFTKRTIRPHEAVTSVDTASEALAVSISEKARVDMEYMVELSGKSEEELAADLSGVIFRDIQCAEEAAAIPKAFVQVEQFPFVAADEYLSGNVRRKLRMAKALYEVLPAEKKPLIAKNIEALEAVQPVDLTAAEIGVRIGANWIPIDVYQKFMVETFGTSYYAGSRIKILRSGATGQWAITEKNADRGNIKTLTTYGTKRMNAYQILEQTLNQRDVRVFDYVEDENGNKKPVLNKKETAIAQDRQELIKQKFSEWIWKDIDRRERLCRIYNETFNAIRPREYDGSHIRFSGMNPEITLRPHQVNAIAHIMYGGNTLLAHEVGAGKTFEMVAAAMEMKRLGLCTKSLIVVPNHITEQWAAEWLQLYPSANILVATKKDFETQNRKKFCARIATGDYDAVIIGHSQFEKIPMSAERQVAILQQQIDEIMFGIEEAKSAKAERYTVKQLERTRKSLEAKLERLNDQSRKDDLVTFEELGVDRVFVDESHYFKNLFLATKMRNVGGIAQTEAQKSSDLFMKCRYLDEITGGRGVIFATGTPISNSMVELYTIQRYLQYDTLQEMGLIHFDDWASDFGETITAIELSPEGSGYRAKTRFAKFFNLPELMATFKQVADIQTAEMLKLPVPKANFHTEVIQPSELQQKMVRGLAERAEAIRAGGVDPRVDNMLRITNDGRKLALDMRLINPLAADDPNGKVATCARNVIRIWEQTKEQRSTQLVFCDLSTPKDDGSFSVYNDLKKKLMEAGIPEEEIAFIHDANTEARKKELFSKVRSGQVRILMGSTQKMGAGTNVQDRLIALHDLDCPWRPSDLAQRLGRIVRQGNRNPEVEIFRYVTEGTFDAYLYQLVENKQKFIAQIMTSKAPVRVADDVDETALSYSEIKALATGNPLIIEKCNLDMEVGKLNMLKASYLSQKYVLEDMVLKKYPETITRLTERIAGYEQDVQLAAAHPKTQEGFVGITILDQPYADKEAAGKAILDVCTKMTGSDAVFLGQYRGFSLVLSYDGPSNEYRMTMKGTLSHTAVLGADVFGNLTRMDNVIDGLSGKLEAVRAELADTQVQLENARTELVAPFAREAELAEKTARLKELNILLNMDQKDKSLIDDVPDEDTPEKSRVRDHER
ncbi:MAG TPA: DEAD/DEAH box helicase family protein [Clostridiales bacterium]|nr:DEAD/DEAH box helicase family protein [Clostridiales bacterium]